MVSVALELRLAPAREVIVAGCVPPDGLLASMVESMLADRGGIAWLLDVGSGPVVERLLNPKLPRMLLEGMVPSDVPARGGGIMMKAVGKKPFPASLLMLPVPGVCPLCSQLLLVLS